MVPSTNLRQGPEFYSPLQSHTAPLQERGIRATQRWRPPLFQAAPFLSCPPHPVDGNLEISLHAPASCTIFSQLFSV